MVRSTYVLVDVWSVVHMYYECYAGLLIAHCYSMMCGLSNNVDFILLSVALNNSQSFWRTRVISLLIFHLLIATQ